MKISSKQAGLCIKSNVPKFKYRFKEAYMPIEIEKGHAEKILRNPNFYESDKPIKKIKTWSDELTEINGIGEKTSKDIQTVFPNKSDLIEALNKGGDLPFDEDVENKLKEVFS